MLDPNALTSATAIILAQDPPYTAPGLEPRILAPVGGQPLLAHLLEQLSQAGVPRAVLCAGTENESVRDSFGDRFEDLALVYSESSNELANGARLREARHLAESSSILVMNAASYCCLDLLELWRWHQVQPAHATVVTATIRNAQGFGRVDADEANRVHHLGGRATIEGPGRINTGIYLVHAPLLERIPAGPSVSIERDLLPRWIENLSVFAYPASGAFLDVRTPQSFSNADRFFLTRRMHLDRLNPTLSEEHTETTAMVA